MAEAATRLEKTPDRRSKPRAEVHCYLLGVHPVDRGPEALVGEAGRVLQPGPRSRLRLRTGRRGPGARHRRLHPPGAAGQPGCRTRAPPKGARRCGNGARRAGVARRPAGTRLRSGRCGRRRARTTGPSTSRGSGSPPARRRIPAGSSGPPSAGSLCWTSLTRPQPRCTDRPCRPARAELRQTLTRRRSGTPPRPTPGDTWSRRARAPAPRIRRGDAHLALRVRRYP